ncbi:hypothetical protein FSP39_004783 [Pinctada imbricata]|uniref:Uncharacterized protein n=1 Tax=Pinctada imbricata TaxID=66713 RepID=A0AA88YS88_PINIB|nr:hypothetical protein FSP39_004783 [Pinctada imbricata]
MAASNTSPFTELTLCPICFEGFKCPKTLPCLHNFCESCIGSYLASVFEKEKDKVKCVSCPICRADVQKPQDVNTSEEWIKCLPTNHMLVSIVEALTGFQHENICNSCNSENKTESAVYWCADCRKALCELCERKHTYFIQGHKVLNVKQMTDIEPKALSASIKCPRHEGKAIEAYCFDHNAPCCSSCVMITHRKCSRVEEAKNAAEELRKSKEILGLQEDFEIHRKKMGELSDKTAENVKSFKDKVADIHSEITTLRSDINRHLDDIELKAKQELNALEKEHVPEMEATVQMMSGETKRAENDLMMQKASVQFASDEQFLCDIEKMRNESNKIKEIWEQNRTKINYKKLIFEMNDELKSLKNVQTFMHVNLTEDKMVMESDPVDLLQAEPVKVSQFDIDVNCSDITGCVMVDDKRVLLATYSLNRVDMYRIDGTYLSCLNLGNEVWGVDVIDKDTGAATLCPVGKVVLFSIDDKNLTLIKTLSFSGVYGMNSYRGKIYVGCTDKIIVLDKNGSLMEEVAQPSRGRIRHLTVADDKIVYTNCNVVQCITLRGEHVFQFSSKDLTYPEGISTDCDNNIYVIGQSSRNIFQLNPQGKFHRVLLQNLPKGSINSLFFCRLTNRLVFNTGKGIHVYEMRMKK